MSNSKLPTRARPRQTWHHSPIHFCHAPFWQRVCIGAVTPASLQIFIFLMVGIGDISILNVLYNYKTVSIIHCIYLNIYFEQMGLCRFIFYVEIECTNVYLHYINQPLTWKYFWISFEEGKLWHQVDLFLQFHQYYLWCVWQQNEIKLQYCNNRGLIYGDPININYESLSATKVVRVQLILITCRIVEIRALKYHCCQW